MDFSLHYSKLRIASQQVPEFWLFPFGKQKYRLLGNMARHGKEMTKEQKEIIIAMSNDGISSYKIAHATKLNSRTIQKFLKRWRGRADIENGVEA